MGARGKYLVQCHPPSPLYGAQIACMVEYAYGDLYERELSANDHLLEVVYMSDKNILE